MTEHERTTRADIKRSVLRAARGRRRRRRVVQAAPVLVILLAAGITWNMAQQPAPPPPGRSLAHNTQQAEPEALAPAMAPAPAVQRAETPEAFAARSDLADSAQQIAEVETLAASNEDAADAGSFAMAARSSPSAPTVNHAVSRNAHRPEEGYLLDDDELLVVLAEMGRPSGLAKRDGRTIVLPHDGRPLIPETPPSR